MAQLKDTVVTGKLHVTDAITADSIQADSVMMPTTSGGTTYGVGADGQIVMSNGTSAYWSDHKHNTYFVKGTQTASTHLWTGNLPEVDALYDGLTIDYYLPYAGNGTAVTLNLTLKGGSTTTGALNVYAYSTNRITTHIPAFCIGRFVYLSNLNIAGTNYTGWWRIYDSSPTDIVNLYEGYPYYKADSVIYRYQLLVQKNSEYFTPLNNANNDVGTSKTMLTNVEFDPFGKIYYYNSTNTANAENNLTNTLFYHRASIDIRYTLNCGTTLTSCKNLYLKVVPQASGKVKLATGTCWAQDLPTTNDGYWYIFLGRAQNTSQVTLYSEHPVYFHDGTRLREAIRPGVLATSRNNYFVKGTQTTSTSTWLGDLPEVEAIYEGLSIDYLLNQDPTSTAATLNLTLKGGATTGDIPVYVSGTTRLSNQVGKYYCFRLTYLSETVNGTVTTGWFLTRSYDNNDQAYRFFMLGGWVANSVVYPYELLFQIDDNTLTPLNNNNTVSTNKTMLTDVAFDPLGQIIYYNRGSAVSANEQLSAYGCLYTAILCDMRYTFNCGQTLTAHKAIYLKVSPQSDGKVKLASADPLTYTLPTTNDGYMYIFLGRTYNNYQIQLYADHPVYYHDGTTIRQYYNMDTSGSGGGGGSIDAYTKTEFHSLTVEKFSTSTTYPLGRLVYYNDNLYMFTVYHYAGAWNSNHVYQINKNMAGIPHFLMNKMTTIYDGDHVTYSPGEFCIYNDGLYQFIKKHTYGTSWSTSEVFSTKLGNQITLTSKNIAPYFNEETNYSIGDYAVYKAELYKFTSAHAAGAWNSSHVTQVAVGSELNSKLDDAPSDNGYYVRRNGDWVSLTSLDSVGY